MLEFMELFKKASPYLIFLVILACTVKFVAEKEMTYVVGKLEEINKTSLATVKDLRKEERDALVDFRVAIDKWEYFLQTAVFDYTMLPFLDTSISDLYEKDKEYFGKVRVSAIKSAAYLRNKDLEKSLNDVILKIRKTYYPLIYGSLPPIIEIKSKLSVFERRLKKFQETGDMAFALTEKDREECLALQKDLTKETEIFAKQITGNYAEIAAQFHMLKEMTNSQIYRPIKEAEIDKN